MFPSILIGAVKGQRCFCVLCFPDRWLKKVRIRVLSTSNYILLVEQYDGLEEHIESSSDCTFETETDENIWKWFNFFVFRYFCMRHSQTFTVNTFISYWRLKIVTFHQAGSFCPLEVLPSYILRASSSSQWILPMAISRNFPEGWKQSIIKRNVRYVIYYTYTYTIIYTPTRKG